MGHGEPFQRRHLGAAVGNDHQLRFPRRQSGIHQRGKCCADTLAEFCLAFPARAAAFAAGFHPGTVLGVVLHLPVIAALKHAKVHLFQPVCHNQFRIGEKHFRRLPGALQGSNHDRFGGKIRPAQLGKALRAQRYIPPALVALFLIILR